MAYADLKTKTESTLEEDIKRYKELLKKEAQRVSMTETYEPESQTGATIVKGAKLNKQAKVSEAVNKAQSSLDTKVKYYGALREADQIGYDLEAEKLAENEAKVVKALEAQKAAQGAAQRRATKAQEEAQLTQPTTLQKVILGGGNSGITNAVKGAATGLAGALGTTNKTKTVSQARGTVNAILADMENTAYPYKTQTDALAQAQAEYEKIAVQHEIEIQAAKDALNKLKLKRAANGTVTGTAKVKANESVLKAVQNTIDATQGIKASDYQNAKKVYQSVINNSSTPYAVKVQYQSLLAELDEQKKENQSSAALWNETKRKVLPALNENELGLIDKYNIAYDNASYVNGKDFDVYSAGQKSMQNIEQQFVSAGYTQEQFQALAEMRRQEANKEMKQAESAVTSLNASQYPILYTLLSVPSSILSGAGMAGLGIDNALGHADKFSPSLDTNSRYFDLANYTDTVRETVKEPMSDVGKFFYGVGTSGLDSIAAAAVSSQVPWLGEILLGSSAGVQTMIDMTDRGATTEQAVKTGLAAAVFESLFEHLSISKLKLFNVANATEKTLKDMLLDILKETGTNASEEGLTELANILYDSFNNGEISSAAIKYNHLLNRGMSEDEAKSQVVGDFAKQILTAAGSGALMGLAFGSAGAVKSQLILNDAKNLTPSERADFYAQKVDEVVQETNEVIQAVEQSFEKPSDVTEAAEADLSEQQPIEEEKPVKIDSAKSRYDELQGKIQQGEATVKEAEEYYSLKYELKQNEEAKHREENLTDTEKQEYEATVLRLSEINELLNNNENVELNLEEYRKLNDRINELNTKVKQDENHIDNRTYESVGARSVKAFQFEYPQLHKYYSDIAQAMLTDVDYTTAGFRGVNKDIRISYDFRDAYEGWKRNTTDEIASLKDEAKLTYEQIEKALNDLIADNGQENYAAAKKVELVIDDMLSNGYTDITGRKVEPNHDYIQAKNAISGEKQGGKIAEDKPGRKVEEKRIEKAVEEKIETKIAEVHEVDKSEEEVVETENTEEERPLSYIASIRQAIKEHSETPQATSEYLRKGPSVITITDEEGAGNYSGWTIDDPEFINDPLMFDYIDTLSGNKYTRAFETLAEPREYNGVRQSESKYIQDAVSKSRTIKQLKRVKNELTSLTTQEQFDYAREKEHLSKAQKDEFMSGRLNTPLTLYFRKGDASKLAEEYFDYAYGVLSDKGYISITEEGYKFAKYLQQRKEKATRKETAIKEVKAPGKAPVEATKKAPNEAVEEASEVANTVDLIGLEAEEKALNKKVAEYAKYALPTDKLDEEKRQEYYRYLKEWREARKKYNAELDRIAALEKSTEQNTPETKKFINGYGEATDREITSSTYNRAQKRLSKQIYNFVGGDARGLGAVGTIDTKTKETSPETAKPVEAKIEKKAEEVKPINKAPAEPIASTENTHAEKGKTILPALSFEKLDRLKQIEKKSAKRKATQTLRGVLINKHDVTYQQAERSGDWNTYYQLQKIASKSSIIDNAIGYRVGKKAQGMMLDAYGNKAYDSLTMIFDRAKQDGIEADMLSDYLQNLHNINRAARGKQAFGGSNYSAAIESDKIVENYRKNIPSISEYEAEIRNYMDKVRQFGVDTGLYTQEFADYLKEIYPNYIPLPIDATKIYSPKEYIDRLDKEVIQRAEQGNAERLNAFDALSNYTKSVMNTGYKNLYLNSLLDLAQKDPDFGAQNIEVIKTDDTQASKNELLESLKGDSKVYVATNGGVSVVFRVSDELNRSIQGISSSKTALEQTKIYEAAEKISGVFKNLVTSWNPAWVLRNPIRDLSTATVNAEDIGGYLKNYPTAWWQMFSNSDEWQRFKAIMSYDTKSDNSKLGEIASSMELVTRFAEYLSVLGEDNSYDNLNKAIYAAKEVTLNFGTSGTLVQHMNRTLFPFLNANVQAMDKVARNFSERKATGQIILLATRMAAFTGSALLWNALRWRDDEDYKNLSNFEKERNLYLWKNKDGKFVKIPLGQTVTAFNIAVNRTIRAAAGKEELTYKYIGDALKDIWQNIGVDAGGNFLGSALIDAANNKTWYGSDLVSEYMANKPVEEQYDSSTDYVSRFLGKTLKISPIKINYIIDQYTGIIGDTLLPLITPETYGGSIPEYLISNIEKGFTTDPVMSNRLSADFKALQEKNEYPLANEYLKERKKVVNSLWKEIDALRNNTSLSYSERNKQIREIRKMINLEQSVAVSQYQTLCEHEKDYEKEGLKYPAGYYDPNMGYVYKDIEYSSEEQYNLMNRDLFGAKYALEHMGVYSASDEAMGIDCDTYFDFVMDTEYMNAKDESGQSVNGLLKQRYLNYLNSTDLIYEQKLYMKSKKYTLSTSEKNTLIRYIDKLDIPYIYKLKIMESL